MMTWHYFIAFIIRLFIPFYIYLICIIKQNNKNHTTYPINMHYTKCNDPDPPLVDIVFFGLPLKALKCVC